MGGTIKTMINPVQVETHREDVKKMNSSGWDSVWSSALGLPEHEENVNYVDRHGSVLEEPMKIGLRALVPEFETPNDKGMDLEAAFFYIDNDWNFNLIF